MKIADYSVKHPVIILVATFIIIAFGLVATYRLPLREYPDVDPPIISIETTYTGASAETIEREITQPIEDIISGVESIRAIETVSRDGVSSINVEFYIQRNIDAAANDIRDRINRVLKDLPEDADAPEIFKVDSNNDVIMWLNLYSNRMNDLQLTDYADRYLVDRFSVLDGVARVRIGGEKRYAMRIWLNRRAMAGKNITVANIEQALRAENIELPAGRIETSQKEFTVQVKRSYLTPADFSKLVVGRGNDGHLVRLGEIAEVDIGAENYRTELRGNQEDMIGLGIIKQSKANTLAVAHAVKREINAIQKALPKGLHLIVSYNIAVFIEAAIIEVFKTLAIAFILVALVIFFFMGSFRAVFIPASAVPLSIIAAMLILYSFNISLNLITLLAFILAIGLVVDDAIVVVENIDRRIQQGEPALLAAIRGTKQVSFAVIATTLVLVAVFLPISLMQGQIGRIFTEFSVTISAAVLFSCLIALTLSPMLSSKLLSPKKNSQHHLIKPIIDNLIQRYQQALLFCLDKRYLFTCLFLLILFAGIGLFFFVPQEFIPQEDRGAFFILVNGPEGAGFEYMQTAMRKVEQAMLPLVKEDQAIRALSILPRGFGSREAVNSGFGLVVMQHWNNRSMTTQQAMQQTADRLVQIPDVQTIPVMRQGLGQNSSSQQVQLVIGGDNYEQLAYWRDIMLEAARKYPGLTNIDSDYKETKPQLEVEIDKNRAAELGVSINDIATTLETLFASKDVTTYSQQGEKYDVILEANPKDRANLQDLANIYVRSKISERLIPLSSLVNLKVVANAGELSRFNRLRAITISANLAPGYTLGQALTYLEKTAAANLPSQAKIAYKGISRDFKEATLSIYLVFLFALLITYLILAAQFESFIQPFIIMLTIPLATTGALLGLWLTSNTLNIYSEIGIIMLAGLAAKNSILIVEFINQLREQGYSFRKAIMDGASVRLRPVLMTSMATVFGAIPLILATGAGANSLITIGIVVFFGVTFATILTLFFIPVFYSLLCSNNKPRGHVARTVAELESAYDKKS